VPPNPELLISVSPRVVDEPPRAVRIFALSDNVKLGVPPTVTVIVDE